MGLSNKRVSHDPAILCSLAPRKSDSASPSGTSGEDRLCCDCRLLSPCPKTLQVAFCGGDQKRKRPGAQGGFSGHGISMSATTGWFPPGAASGHEHPACSDLARPAHAVVCRRPRRLENKQSTTFWIICQPRVAVAKVCPRPQLAFTIEEAVVLCRATDGIAAGISPLLSFSPA